MTKYIRYKYSMFPIIILINFFYTALSTLLELNFAGFVALVRLVLNAVSATSAI